MTQIAGNELPVVIDRDSGGKKKSFQYTCATCVHGRRCVDRRFTTDDATECPFTPSRFIPHPSVPLVWTDKPRKWKDDGTKKNRLDFENPIEITGNGGRN